jgi:hypothetical protein
MHDSSKRPEEAIAHDIDTMANKPAAGRLPSFLVIGAPKCGTTSLYHYLDQHPDVYLSPVKEPQYFAFAGQQLDFKGPGVTINNAVTELADYRKLFSGASVEKAIGEASALYLSVPGTAERIRAQIPDVRLIAILRRPADRAFSSYMHLIRDDREPMRDFGAALAAEEQRIADNWGFLWRYKQLGRYYEQLKHYYDIFDREQILVLLQEDLKNDTENTLARIFGHIGVQSGIAVNSSTRFNASGTPRCRFIYDLIRKNTLLKQGARSLLPDSVRQKLTEQVMQKMLRRERMSNELRAELTSYFADDILDLEQLIERDLSDWR